VVCLRSDYPNILIRSGCYKDITIENQRRVYVLQVSVHALSISSILRKHASFLLLLLLIRYGLITADNHEGYKVSGCTNMHLRLFQFLLLFFIFCIFIILVRF